MSSVKERRSYYLREGGKPGPPATESPSEEQESVSNTDQKRKCVSSRVMVNEVENEEDEIVKVITLELSKAQVIKLHLQLVQRWKAKEGCSTSLRSQEKGKRLSEIRWLFLYTSIDKEENKTPPCKKVKTLDLATQASVEIMKLIILTMSMKIYRILKFLSEFQAYIKMAEMFLASQQMEMDQMEALQEQL
ncbi:hypothetical protein HD554DRAFT_2038187 [Boletus coccyginus]|nr:hypothetical protein HD554DRAFT_2038187 [Boletus coccyginus]